MLKLNGMKRRSRVVQGTLNPNWKQNFDFPGVTAQLMSSTLTIEIFDKDTFSYDDPLGATSLPMSKLLVSSSSKRASRGMGLGEQTFTHQLPTQGTVTFRVRVNDQTRLDAAYVSKFKTVMELAAEPATHKVLPSFGPLRNQTTAAFTVQVKAAVGLMAADSGGTSDPYVLMTVGGATHRTHTVSKTVNPVWNDEFPARLMLGQLFREPAVFQVMDEDQFSRDDLLGKAELSLEMVLEHAAAMFAARDGSGGGGGGGSGGGGSSGDVSGSGGGGVWIRLPLVTSSGRQAKGELLLKLYLEELVVPSWTQLLARLARPPDWVFAMAYDAPMHARRMCSEHIMPIARVTEWPARLRKVREDSSIVRVSVLMQRGMGLRAADFSLSRLGSSDPYVRLNLGTQVYQTRVVKKTLEPVWDQEFSWSVKRGELEQGPLALEVFDDDLLSADDSLGIAEVKLAPLVERALASPAARLPAPPEAFTLELTEQGGAPGQGSVTLQVTICAVDPPPWSSALFFMIRPLLLRARAFFLCERRGIRGGIELFRMPLLCMTSPARLTAAPLAVRCRQPHAVRHDRLEEDAWAQLLHLHLPFGIARGVGARQLLHSIPNRPRR